MAWYDITAIFWLELKTNIIHDNQLY